MTTGPDDPYGEPQQPQQQPPNPYHPGQQPPPYQQPYQQQPYQQPYAYQAPYGYQPQPPVPNHPSATTSMVLGIIALAGIATCAGVTLVLAPFAWAIGAKSLREIKANPGAYAGEGTASAGKIMGIIGTILLIIGVLAFIAIIAIAVAADSSGSTSP